MAIKRIKGKLIDWQGNRGIIIADSDEKDISGKPFGDAWFFVRKYNMEPHPDDVRVVEGEEVAFLWCHEKDKMLATDVVRLRHSKARVFLAHSSKDKPFVEKLASALLKSGVLVWLDKWEILVGDPIVDKINDGIQDSDFLGIVLSTHSVSSHWVRMELSAGLMRELSRKSVLVLPILIDDCEIPPLISDKYYADFRQDFNKGLIDLVNSIRAKRYDL